MTKHIDHEHKTDIAMIAKERAERGRLVLLTVAVLIAAGVTILGLLMRFPPAAGN